MSEAVAVGRPVIDAILNKYDGQASALIQILLDIQKEKKWLEEGDLFYLSQRLNVPLPRIYQIATFYKAFSLTDRGRHLVMVCMGTACHVRQASMLLDRISQKLAIGPSMTTADKRFTLLTVNCMGCCALGPVMAVDEAYFSNPSSSELDGIFGKYT